MATPSASMFSTPDYPGDTSVVLVLLEGSAGMLSLWGDARNYFLPIMFDALCASHPDTPIHVIWQVTADPYDQAAGPSTLHSTYSEAHRQVPDMPFDHSRIRPLSPSNVRTSLETLRAATPRDRSWTKHLIVIAMSSPLPSSPGPAQPNVFGGPESWQSIAMMLYQDRVRLHMILNSSSQLNMLREFHRNALAQQARPEAPLWFQVNSMCSVHLAARHMHYGSEGGSPVPAPAAAGPIHSNPVTPTRTSVSLPMTSPIHESPGSNHSLSSSPPSRRPRPKSRESLVPPQPEPGSPGLVDYLKQMHGLTKKRTHGGKAVKKAATGTDAPRASTSRPILPRLELPPATLAANDLKGKATEIAALQAASAGNSRYAPIAPAVSPTRTPPEEARRAAPRRWPWIQPAPLTSSVPDAPKLSPSTAAALRSLQAIAPRVADHRTQLPGEQQSSTRSRNGSASDAPPSRNGPSSRTQTHRPATMPPYSIPSASQSDDLIARPAYRHMPNDHRYTAGDTAYPSQARSPVMQQQPAAGRTYPAQQQHYNSYQYASQPSYVPQPGHVSPGLRSPSHPGPSSDQDSENQPFLISAEYEAMANAEFEEAVRSGAMQASMTPTVLSPVASSPVHGSAGYFPLDPDSTSAMMPSTMQQTPTVSQARPSYSYTQSRDTQVGHDVLYNQSQAPGAETTSSPPSHVGFYSPPSGDDRDQHRWYGA